MLCCHHIKKKNGNRRIGRQMLSHIHKISLEGDGANLRKGTEQPEGRGWKEFEASKGQKDRQYDPRGSVRKKEGRSQIRALQARQGTATLC